MAWSPDGSAVAAEAMNQTVGTSHVEVFSPTGDRLATIPGYDFGWLDGTHLLVYETTPNDEAVGSVSEWTTDGRRVQLLPGRFGGVMANGHGVALLRRAPPPGAYAGTDFQFWADGRLSSMLTAPGMPVAWSPDGRRVAVTQSTATVRSDGIVFAATGGPITGFVSVLGYPDGSVVRSFRDHPLDVRGGVAWSPDSRYIAAWNYDGVGSLVFDLATGGVAAVNVPESFARWTPDDRLAITKPDGTTVLWSASGTLAASGLPPGYPVWGPSMDEVAILPEGQPPGLTVMLRTLSANLWVPVDSSGPGFPVAWAPDGASCLLTTGSTVSGVLDTLLLVRLR